MDHRDEGLERTLQQALDGGNSVWAVGDVHGHRETLEALMGKLGLVATPKLKDKVLSGD